MRSLFQCLKQGSGIIFAMVMLGVLTCDSVGPGPSSFQLKIGYCNPKFWLKSNAKQKKGLWKPSHF